MGHFHSRPFRLFFEHRPYYLYAHLSSVENSFEIAKGYWVEILSMIHRRRYKRVLIDKDVATRLAAHEVFDLVSELAHSHLHSIKFAINDRNYDERACSFEQLVGTNRGLQLKISNNRYELEEWLLEESSVAPNREAFPHASGKVLSASAAH